MADEWFFASNGKSYGPFSSSQLQQMTEAGVVDYDDLVWRDGDSMSNPASTVGNEPPLPAAASRPSPPLLPADSTPTSSRPSSRLAQFTGATVLLALIGGTAWLAYHRGWLPTLRQQEAEEKAAIAPAEPSSLAEDQDETSSGTASPEIQRILPSNVQDGENAEPDPATIRSSTASLAGQRERSRAVIGRTESGNVALASRGAVVTGPYKGVEALLDGRTRSKEGYAKAKLNAPIVVTLPEIYQIRSLRIHLIAAWLPNNSKESFYRYKVEVSDDGVNYQMVADRTHGRHRDWQNIEFTPRPVKAIRITGTHDHPHQTGIRIAEIEAYCTN